MPRLGLGLGLGTRLGPVSGGGATLVSIDVTPVNPSVALGLTQQFTATGHYSNGTTADLTLLVTWASSDPTKATIDAAGLATTVAQGPTTISATLNAVVGSTTLTVAAAALTSITVTPSNPSVPLGLTQQFTATGHYTNGTTANVTNTATWVSSDPTKATINSTGLATTVAQGPSTISATIGMISGSTLLTVAAPALVSIAVTPTNPTIIAGSTQQMTATGTYTNGSTANVTNTSTWTSGTPAAATVNGTGLVTGVAAGSSVITATIGMISGNTTASVLAALPSFNFTTLSPGAATLPTGLTFSRSSIATVQTGTSTLVTSGIGVNVPRAGRRLTSDPIGLVIEVSSTNDLLQARDTSSASWQAGTISEVRPSAIASPDGSTTTATDTTTTGGAYGRYFQFTASSGVVRTFSMWAISTAGTSITGTWQVGAPNQTYSATGFWQRIIGQYTTTGVVFYLTPCNGTIQAITHDLHMGQPAAYPTEFINTTTVPATCSADIVTCTVDQRRNNQLRLEFLMKAKGASNEYAGDMFLWFGDANNSARISSTTGAMIIRIGGVQYTTPTAASWARNDDLSFWIAVGVTATVVKYRVGTGLAVTLSTGSPPTYATVPMINRILFGGSTNQFSCWAYKCNAYEPGTQPAWV